MKKMKFGWRLGVLALHVLMARGAVHAWTPDDMGGTPGLMKAGITVFAKGTQTPLPFVTMRFNVASSTGTVYYYLTSDASGFAYLQVPMTPNGVIEGIDVSGTTRRIDLRDLANTGNQNYRVDTDPITEWEWGTVSAGYDTRWLLTGHHSVQLKQNAGGGYSHDNACLNSQDTDGNGRYDWQDQGCSFHFSCYVKSTALQHEVMFDLSDGVANTSAFATRTVNHGTVFNTNTPVNTDPDYKFDRWQVCSPDHVEATVEAPQGALSIPVYQRIRLKPLWKYEPGEPPPVDDPTVQFCHDVERNILKVAMKFYDWQTGDPLKNVTIGLCFTIPNPLNPNQLVRRDNVVSATTDGNGELKMLVPFESDGYILVNGVKSTEINLNTVTKIDCGPDAAIGWNWNVTTAGRVRNYPSGYGIHTERIPEAGYHNAVVTKADANHNGIWDYVEEGASLYFECYLQHVSGGDTRSILYDYTTIQNVADLPNTTCAHGGVFAPPATPVNKTSPDRAFLGWICKPLTIENKEAAYTDGAFNYAAPLTVNENLMFVPVWGPNPNARGRIRFEVRMWNHAAYWDNQSKWQSNPDVLGPQYGHIDDVPVDGLTFVLKTYDSIYHTTLPDSVKRPVGRPNTPEGWADSRIEINYTGKDADGHDTWEGVYEISTDQLQYLNTNWIIDTDPDEQDLATYDRGKGWGPETVTFDWDWFIMKDDREGAGLTGVRVIPQCQRRGGIYPNGHNKNDVIQLDDEMIANGFDFTFQCWVVPALVVDFDTDDGTPKTYPEQRFLPLDSCPFWEQRFQAENPGSPTRGGNEHFEGWYEILSTDQYGNDTLASAPWNFGKTVEHSMTLKAVYRKTGYDVTPTDPAVIRVKGPGTLTFQEILNNPNNDPNTTLSIKIDGGEPVYVTSDNMTAYETKTIVFGGEVDIEHVVEVSFATTQTGAGTSGNVRLDQVQWVPYDTNITDAVADRESTIFKLENLGTNPAGETRGVTFFDGVDKKTTSTVDPVTGRQTSSTVNPPNGTGSTTGTEDYWYLNYDSQRNQLLPTGVQQIFAETPPTLSAEEKTSFQVTGITGASVIRWESFVADGAAGDTVPSELTVTVTLTPKNGPVRTETHVYRASDFSNGEFKPELLDFKDEPVSTQIVLDFTYTNNDQGDGRAYVDNIYWKCVQEQGGHTWIDPEPEEGVALMIVDHEDAGDGYVYLAFTPQIKEGFDPQEWFKSSTKQGFFKVKTDASRSGVEGAEPVQIELSDIHTSTPEKVWVKVPLSVVEAGEFSRLFVGGKPIPYKNLDGSTNYTSQAGSGATSVNTFGDLKVVTKTANTMVAVPWTWYSDQENNAMPIPADKLVKTENLSENDMLYSYSESGVYLAWTVKGKHWVPMTTLTQESPTPVGANSVAITPGQVTLPRGAGVWVVRQHPTDAPDGSGNAIPFWIYGQSVNTPAETVITPPQNGEDSHSTMLGNPFPVGMKINDLVFEGTIGENDTIIVPNGTDSPKYLQYRDTGTGRTRSGTKKWAWAYVDTSTGTPKNMYDWDVTVPPGLAFWYVRRGTGVLKVKWNVPSSGK